MTVLSWVVVVGTLYNLLVYFFSCGYGAGLHLCERLNLHACTFQLYILMEDYYLWRARSFSQSQLLDISWSRSFIINTRHQLAKPITYTSHSFKSRQAKLVILSIDARTSRCQAKHSSWIPSQILEGTQSRCTHSPSTCYKANGGIVRSSLQSCSYPSFVVHLQPSLVLASCASIC